MNISQYQRHIEGIVGADEEKKWHIVALAQRLHAFRHQIEEREMELWRRLSGALDFPRVESLMARN